MISDEEVRQGGVTRRELLYGAAATGALAFAGSSLLGACGKGSPAPSTSSGSAAVRRGGSLTIGMDGGSSTDTLDPERTATDADISRTIQLCDTLLIFNPQYQREYALAEEVEASPDATVWTIRVRDGVEFHDGKPLTAQDIAYTFMNITDPKNLGDAAPQLTALDRNSLKVLDNRTLRLTFKKPFSAFLDTLAESGSGAVRVIPVGFNRSKPIGTGPFRYRSFEPGVNSVFDRNPNYWREGQPYVDELTITDFTDDAARVNALLSGQVDAIAIVPSTQLQVIKANPKLHVLESQTGSWTPIVMRTDVAPFQDVRVRQAFRLLADRSQLVEQVLANHGSIANDLYARYDSDYNQDIPQRPLDVEQAKSLLRQAGQENLSLEFVTSPVSTGRIESAQVFVQQANSAGLNLKLRQVDATTFYDRYFLKAPLAQSTWATRYYLPQAAVTMLPTAPYNDTHWSNAKWDALVSEALATVDEQKAKELIGEAQKIEWNEGGYINWGWANVFDAYTEHVHGLVPDKSGFSLTSFSFRQAWLSA
jgi:peptide/nickel transport system substrate-binding protein